MGASGTAGRRRVQRIHTLTMFAELGDSGRARYMVLLALAGRGDDLGEGLPMMDQLALLRAASLPRILDEGLHNSDDVIKDVKGLLDKFLPEWRDFSARPRAALEVL